MEYIDLNDLQEEIELDKETGKWNSILDDEDIMSLKIDKAFKKN
jgi:hypothetical protein